MYYLNAGLLHSDNTVNFAHTLTDIRPAIALQSNGNAHSRIPNKLGFLVKPGAGDEEAIYGIHASARSMPRAPCRHPTRTKALVATTDAGNAQDCRRRKLIVYRLGSAVGRSAGPQNRPLQSKQGGRPRPHAPQSVTRELAPHIHLHSSGQTRWLEPVP